MLFSSFHRRFVMVFGYSRSDKNAGHTEGDSFGSPAVFFKTRCFPHPSHQAKGRLYREWYYHSVKELITP